MVPAAVSCGSSHHLFRRREHHLRKDLFPEPNLERWLVVGKPPRWRSAVVGNGLSDTPDLAGDPDLEPVRMVVTAIALVAVDAADGNPPDTWKELLAAASSFIGSQQT
jgi:hypothetical protein